MDREILHITVPAFPIALARVGEERLRDRPVAVAPLNSERALLQSVSPEAEAEGIFAGTPVFRAKRACPSLTLIPPDPILIGKGNQALLDVSGEFTPVIEPGTGRVFLDLTASRRLFGPARDVAARLEKSISRRLGLRASAGTGTNKLVSRVAADVLREPGVYDVMRGSERLFLSDFPVSVLPGVGESRQLLLFRDLNLQRVGEVASLSVKQLRLAVGPFAPLLHDRACGIDRSPVQPPARSHEIVEEGILEAEANDDAVLLSELLRLAEGCGFRLRRLGKGARRISLTINYADGLSDEGRKTLPSPLSLDMPLFAAVEELFFSACKRRQRVRRLRLACCDMNQHAPQMELFPAAEEETGRYTPLQETLDAVRERFGSGAIRWGRSMAIPRDNPPEIEPPPGWDPEPTRYMTLTKRG